MKKIRVGLDVDDVLYECNSLALEMLNKDEGTNYQLADIKSWGLTGTALDHRLNYMKTEEFHRAQPLCKGAQEFVHELSKIADVFITSAVEPEMMGVRAERLLSDFPELKPENIILGGRKDLYHLDFCLDDGEHNILSSQADYPVLMRRPWNYNLTGLLAVNTYDEFLQYIRHIVFTEPVDAGDADIICLIAPSGSGKADIVKQCIDSGKFVHPLAFSTSERGDYIHLTDEQFEEMKSEFFETSVYAGYRYGYRKSDIENAVKDGKKAVMAVDICGAMAMKLAFPKTCLCYVRKPKHEIVMNVLKMDITDECKAARILSLDDEKKNASICDIEISSFEELGQKI